jgi:hypothetical protein
MLRIVLKFVAGVCCSVTDVGSVPTVADIGVAVEIVVDVDVNVVATPAAAIAPATAPGGSHGYTNPE